jgi:hypothetical protein
MPHISKLSLLVVMIAASLGSARAQGGIPPGSYQQTCVNIQMQSWTLYANCQDTEGRWRSAVLPDVRGCAGQVTNLNGQLHCDRGEGWRAGDSLPGGSYRQTCRSVKLRGDRLSAQCESVNGSWTRTSLDDIQQCVGDIVNDDGQLQCSRQAWRASGPYMQSCRQIYVRGDDLRASCQARDGHWVWTSLDHYQACQAPIVNWDGQLRCGGGDYDRDRGGYGPGLPPGSYSQTCRDIQIQGDRLHANCQDREGRWRSTDLDDFRRCQQGIVNLDGHLSCAQ